jgi:outer membrane receptor for ferrienterochelin and colicins
MLEVLHGGQQHAGVSDQRSTRLEYELKVVKTSRMELSEYVGLPNRSKHMANFKLTYENENYFTNLRIIYRSKWAVSDKDGNGLYDSNDGFANAFAQINIAAGKQINKQFRLQIGCDNVINYIDIANLPNLPGRTFYSTLSYQFLKKNKK